MAKHPKQPISDKITARRKYYFAGLFILIACIGGLIGWYVEVRMTPAQNVVTEVRDNSDQYTFINPLLFYKSVSDSVLDPLKNQINSYINKAESSGEATSVSMYYRDMNSGDWTGINEQETYEPASMLKVIYMMGYLDRAKDDPTIFDKSLYYNASERDTASFYKADDNLPSGYYTVNDLINYMIVYSDNAALEALARGDDGHVGEVFSAFQLPAVSTSSSTPDFMSAQAYSRIFRVLYDSTYLPWNLSEQALKILSLTDYKDGLVSGVPDGTTVSHKFGERTYQDQNGIVRGRELHDCGIIYKGKNPYFLCVMTKGDDFTKLQKIISDISAIVYKEAK